METKTLTVSEEKIREAMSRAQSKEAKEILQALFPDVKKKPTLDDYTSITSYEDACEALGEYPVFSPNYVRGLGGKEDEVEYCIYGREKGNTQWRIMVDILPRHIIALMKLETISRALWGFDWEPKPDAEGDKMFYWPWFALYTKDEIRDIDDTKKGALLSAHANHGADAVFGCLADVSCSLFACAYFGIRLCQETEEKARYLGSCHFVKLWAEYLQFNFETGDFIAQV